MRISNILHVQGTKMSLYSSSYFSKTQISVDSLKGGQLYGYGRHATGLRTVDDTEETVRMVVDVRKVIDSGLVPSLFSTFSPREDWIVHHPLVVPDKYFIDKNKKRPTGKLVSSMLATYDKKGGTVKYLSVKNEPRLYLGYGDYTKPSLDNQREVLHSLPDAVISQAQNTVLFDINNTVPIVNGLFCYPVPVDNRLYATNGKIYSRNLKDRDRGVVLMDFSLVGGMTCYKIRELGGPLTEFKLPAGYDPTKQSLLLVVDGRLFTPEEFEVYGDRILFDRTQYNALCDLDKRIASNEFIWNTSDVEETGYRSLYKSPNTFLIVINKPYLQVYRHSSKYPTHEQMLKWGSSSYASLLRNEFAYCARGLLVDETCRAVHDYAREPHDMTFYAEASPVEREWQTSVVTVPLFRPFVLLQGNADNFMLARATMFYKSLKLENDVSIWPRFKIYDFVFRAD